MAITTTSGISHGDMTTIIIIIDMGWTHVIIITTTTHTLIATTTTTTTTTATSTTSTTINIATMTESITILLLKDILMGASWKTLTKEELIVISSFKKSFRLQSRLPKLKWAVSLYLINMLYIINVYWCHHHHHHHHDLHHQCHQYHHLHLHRCHYPPGPGHITPTNTFDSSLSWANLLTLLDDFPRYLEKLAI